MALVFMLIGCNSNDKSLDNAAVVSTDISVNEGNTPPDTNDATAREMPSPVNEGDTSPDINDATATETTSPVNEENTTNDATATGTPSSVNEGNTTNDATAIETTENREERLSKPVIVETKPSNWYIRLIAEDPAKAMRSAGSQLGELEESSAVEKHTLKALTPFGASYIDVVFVDPDGVASGDYKVNFHRYEEGVEDRWRFTVRTDDAVADILLTWRGLYVLTPYVDEQNRQRYKEYRSVSNPLIKNMKLLDVSNGNEIAAIVDGKVQTYSFNMNGENERTFQWIVQIEEVTLPVQQSKMSTLQAKALQIDAKTRSVQAKVKKIEIFDLSKPPMIKENSFGK